MRRRQIFGALWGFPLPQNSEQAYSLRYAVSLPPFQNGILTTEGLVYHANITSLSLFVEGRMRKDQMLNSEQCC